MSLSKGLTSRWLFGPAVDLSLIGVPIALAFSLMAVLPPDFGKPLWAYVLFVVSFDVAHVWTTGYLTYFDRQRFALRRRFLTWIVPAVFVASFVAHRLSPVGFWTVVAYVAVFHFIRQQWGFVAIYRVLAGERSRVRLDKVTLWTGALGPIALWHADPDDIFAWFDAGEQFAFRLPEWVGPWVLAWMGAVAVVWGVSEVRAALSGRPLSWGKVSWMVGSWLSWWFGLRVAPNFLVATAFINLFHGVPYTALVWWRARGERPSADALPGRGLKASTWGWAYFYGSVLVLALLEETLWDGLVWRSYASLWGGDPDAVLGATALSLSVAFLSLPQVVHYLLDAVLWRGSDARNGDFSALLKSAGPESR